MTEEVKKRKRRKAKRTRATPVANPAEVDQKVGATVESVAISKKIEPSSWFKKWFHFPILRNIRKYLFLVGGVLACAIGVFVGWLWTLDPHNMAMGLGTIIIIGVGAFLIYRGFSSEKVSEQVPMTEGAMSSVPGEPNSINVYVEKEPGDTSPHPKKIAFEYVEHPKGHPHPVRNLKGKHFYFHIIGPGTENPLRALRPPDKCLYYDPSDYANVITLPAHKRWYATKQSIFQKLAPGWLVLVNFILFIALITVGDK